MNETHDDAPWLDTTYDGFDEEQIKKEEEQKEEERRKKDEEFFKLYPDLNIS